MNIPFPNINPVLCENPNQKKHVEARNPVEIGNSCAAVTGHNFPITNLRKTGGEGGKKERQKSEYLLHKLSSGVSAVGRPEKTSSQKKKNEGPGNRPGRNGRAFGFFNNQETKIMKKQIITLAAACLASLSGLRADTSYLLVQGPFGAGDTEETFEWQVNYQSGQLLTGQDLLNAVFGTPSPDGTYTDGFGGTYPYSAAGNATQGADYISFSGSPFVVAFTLSGSSVEQDPSYSPGWSYYVAGGAGSAGSDDNGAPYASGTWTLSNDGSDTRTLANDSFDAWVFGSTLSPPEIAGSGNAPTAADFAGATVVSVPEPASEALFAAGACVLVFYMRRRNRGPGEN